MKLAGLLPAALADRALARTQELAGQPGQVQTDITAPPASRPFVVAAVAAHQPVLAVTATSREADDLADALGCLLPAGQRGGLPVLGDAAARAAVAPVRHGRPPAGGAAPARAPRPGRPAAGGRRAGAGGAAAAAQGPRRPRAGRAAPPAATADLDDVVQRLTDVAYARVDLVTKRGEFAVRGGILDVFPPTEEHPLRVEFWGDEVEEIRTFAVADQRTIDTVDRPLRAAVPGAAAHRRRAGQGRRAGHRAPAAGRDARQARRGHPGRGHGVARAGPARRHRLAGAAGRLACRAARTCCSATRSASAPGRTTWSAPRDEFLQASWAAAAVGGKAPIDLGAASFKTLADVRAHAAALRPALVDGVARSAWSRRRRAGATTSRGATRTRTGCPSSPTTTRSR